MAASVRRLLLASTLLVWGAGSVGCHSKECARMIECCKSLEDVEGVGGICNARARSVDDPKTCKTVLETVAYMYEDRGERPPEVCRLSPES